MSIVGIGIDLVDLERARRMLERHGDRAMHRLLTPAEREYVQGAADPARHFAARLAAKEAVFKALQALPGARAISWLDVVVVRGPEGAPAAALTGRAEAVARSAPGLVLHLSLTHSDATAGAVAIAEVGPGARAE
jgi:holo-[acyl-carrier protein] synthase